MNYVGAIAQAKAADDLLARYMERKRFYALLRNKFPPQSGLSPTEIKGLRKDLAVSLTHSLNQLYFCPLAISLLLCLASRYLRGNTMESRSTWIFGK